MSVHDVSTLRFPIFIEKMATLIFQGPITAAHIRKLSELKEMSINKLHTFISGEVSQENLLLFAGLTDINNVGEEVVMVRFVNDLAELV